MIINGSGNPHRVVWAEKITVTSNTPYKFSCWVASVSKTYSYNKARLAFSINGTPLAPVFFGPPQIDIWRHFTADWYSDTVVSAYITTTDLNKNLDDGNDFGLDDISFRALGHANNVINNNITFYPNPSPGILMLIIQVRQKPM